MKLNNLAVKIAVKIVAMFEGVNLNSYPDPASPLYTALSNNNMLHKYMSGAIKWKDLPDNFKALSGIPFTVGFGETKGITKDTVWTQEQAKTALEARVKEFMTQCIKDCPELETLSPTRIAAITSFAYNVGSTAFKNSTACKRIVAGDYQNVPEAIQRYNKAGGKIMNGLVRRREVESNLWMAEE